MASTSDPRTPLSGKQVALAMIAVGATSLASLVALIGAAVASICGVLEGECNTDEPVLSSVLLVVGGVLLLATAPAGGLILKRWWAWCTPLVLGAGIAILLAIL